MRKQVGHVTSAARLLRVAFSAPRDERRARRKTRDMWWEETGTGSQNYFSRPFVTHSCTFRLFGNTRREPATGRSLWEGLQCDREKGGLACLCGIYGLLGEGGNIKTEKRDNSLS